MEVKKAVTNRSRGRILDSSTRLRNLLPCLILFASINVASAQQGADTSRYTLDQCISYALRHEPGLNAARTGQSITKVSNAISMSGWLPQVNGGASLTHYLQLPTVYQTSATSGLTVKTKTGVINTFIPNVGVTQAIFSPSLVYAARSQSIYLKAAEQVTDSSKINVIANVTKTYYGLLLTLEQINVLKEDTARLNKNLSDTYHQYVSGIVDETDYDEASIELNNSSAQLRQAVENVVPQYAALKQSMGFPADSQFNVSFDTTQMMRDVAFDTTQALQYKNRIEFQQLMTAKNLQHQLTSYYHQAWLPTLSSFFYYNLEFQNNDAAQLLSTAFPNSYAGLSLNIPIFTGLSRWRNEQRSRMEEGLLDFDEARLSAQIYTEYTTALASYKGNLYNLEVMQKNVDLAKRTYNIVELQYKQGVVAYLNVITAESNLITSEIGYLNALFQLLSSKIDLEKAMGYISYNRN